MCDTYFIAHDGDFFVKNLKLKLFGIKLEVGEIDSRSLLIFLLALVVPVSVLAVKIGGFWM